MQKISSIRLLALMVSLMIGPVVADVFDDWSDPTRPHTGAVGDLSASRGAMALQSTMVSPQRRIAIIDGRSYTVGSRLANYVVAAIETNEVVLRYKNNEKRLRLLPPANFRQAKIVETERHVSAR